MFFGIAIAVLAVFLFFFIFGYYIFVRACRRRSSYITGRQEHSGGHGLSEQALSLLNDVRTWFDTQDFEILTLPSHDGLCLRGRFLRAEQTPRGIVLLFHGYHSSERRDFAVQAKSLHEAGYHLLLVSERSHGKSEGKYICFGVRERHDVLAWARFAADRFGELPLALFGLSMGGASVLMSASLELPAQVRVLISDCGFTSPWEILVRTLRRRHKIYPYPVIYFVNFWARMLAQFDFRECSVEESLQSSSLPTLLLHGEDDLFVPAEMSIRAAKSAPWRTELLLVKGARHGQAILFATEEYTAHLLSFLEKHL